MVMYPRRCALLLATVVALSTALPASADAQAVQGQPSRRSDGEDATAVEQKRPSPTRPAPKASVDNGIFVGRPKIFDNRALTIMIDEWQKALRNVQMVDQAKLAAAFGLLQGSSMRETASALSVATRATPQVTDNVVTNTGLVDDKGNPLPDTTTTTTDTTRAAFTPQPPSLDALPAFSGTAPAFGQHPSDLLSDQVNLTYQIFNLRMLLERSLSDRLLSDSSGTARRQAVVGFNISVDPPRNAEDAVAVVEVTFTAKEGQKADGLSLVSLMPQEKTYNATALSTKQNAFGGAAVAGMFTVGYNQRSRAQNFYVYRDADTVAYERAPEGLAAGDNGKSTVTRRDQVVFGWMFRPVLGRKAVSPGLRQMFAVISLPDGDLFTQEGNSQFVAAVRTYWKKYDRDTMTSFESREANRAARLRYFLSANLAKPEIFDSRYVNEHIHDGISVNATSQYDNGLKPSVTNLRWTLVGPKTVVISAEGDNFFSGTQITVAGKTYVGNGDGLLLKSNQAFDLTTGIEAIESGIGSIIGRYGAAVELRVPCRDPEASPSLGDTAMAPEHGGWRRVTVTVKNFPTCFQSPVLSVDGSVLPPPYEVKPTADGSGAVISTFAQASVVSGSSGRLKVSWPFMPASLTLYDVLYDPDTDYHYTKLGDNVLLLTTSGALPFDVNPNDADAKEVCWHILTESGDLTLKTEKCPNGTPKSDALSRTAIKVSLDKGVPDRLFLVSPLKRLIPVSLDKEGKAAPEQPKPLSVAQFDAVWLPVPVKDARAIAKVESNGKELRKQYKPSADSDVPVSVLNVELTRELTKDPGSVDLSFWDAKGQLTGQSRVTITCTKCATQEK